MKTYTGIIRYRFKKLAHYLRLPTGRTPHDPEMQRLPADPETRRLQEFLNPPAGRATVSHDYSALELRLVRVMLLTDLVRSGNALRTLTALALVLLAACGMPPAQLQDGTAPVIVEREVVTELRTTLETWPTCATSEHAEVLTVGDRWCTKKFCGDATCCNSCSWSVPSALASVVPTGGLDCDQRALNALLGTLLIDSAATCVVR